MRQLPLAARYRPQKFADVAGQPLAASALSRAAATDRVAPAYLLSGTRGVGKTTIARIFAKALNCESAPGPEPCNECAQCRHVTAGNHVDVNEIDGASNTGVDDVRALRETIGFVPMEGRYKIFIVDEAHMLSKNAFNALLKTLEEPPKHTVFIFATTEAHRFPATIISRCQHFVFRHLPEQAIHDHLAGVLAKENVDFEEGAVRLIARRAQGSVRDSLSLLDQVLAVNSGKLLAEQARDALGVAGFDLQGRLLEAMAAQDCGQIVDLAASLLNTGLDIGFFSRELAALWRNLFLLRQTGRLMPGLAADEAEFLNRHAGSFTAAHLHSAWQMTLESQRSIAQSPEPGAALELLLLNIALLPQLLPVGSPRLPRPEGLAESAAPSYEAKQDGSSEVGQQAACAGAAAQVRNDSDAAGSGAQEGGAVPAGSEGEAPPPAAAPVESSGSVQAAAVKDWQGFCDFCRMKRDSGGNGPGRDILAQLQCDWQPGAVRLTVGTAQLWSRLQKVRGQLESWLREYAEAPQLGIEYSEPAPAQEQPDLAEIGKRPEVMLCKKILGAEIMDGKLKAGGKNAEHE